MIMNDNKLEWLVKRVERIEERLTWIERLLMRKGRELGIGRTGWDLLRPSPNQIELYGCQEVRVLVSV